MVDNGFDMEDLARGEFKQFVSAIHRLIIVDNILFDIILVSGNTGLVMARLTQMVYWHLGISPPSVLKSYLTRYVYDKSGKETLFDNSLLLLDIKNQLIDYNIKTPKKVLFVDDEIGSGITARLCLNLLVSALDKKVEKIDYYIVAKDMGFSGFQTSGDIKIFFLPFAHDYVGSNHVVLKIIPEEILTTLIKGGIDERISLNVLLDLPSRDWNDPLSGFTYRLNQKAKNVIPTLNIIKADVEMLLSQLIGEALAIGTNTSS